MTATTSRWNFCSLCRSRSWWVVVHNALGGGGRTSCIIGRTDNGANFSLSQMQISCSEHILKDVRHRSTPFRFHWSITDMTWSWSLKHLVVVMNTPSALVTAVVTAMVDKAKSQRRRRRRFQTKASCASPQNEIGTKVGSLAVSRMRWNRMYKKWQEIRSRWRGWRRRRERVGKTKKRRVLHHPSIHPSITPFLARLP